MLRINRFFGSKNSSFQTRLLQRIVPLVVGIFIVVGLISIIAIQVATNNRIVSDQQASVARVSQDLTDTLNRTVQKVRLVATSENTREFALVASGNASSGNADVQNAMFQDFITAMRTDTRLFLAMRFVTSDGSVYGTITSVDGLLQAPDPSFHRDAFQDPTEKLYLQNSLKQSAGSVLVGNFTYRSEPSSQITLTLYAPVIATVNSLDQTLGVIQVDLAAENLLNTINVPNLADVGTGQRLILFVSKQVAGQTPNASQTQIAADSSLTDTTKLWSHLSDPVGSALPDPFYEPLLNFIAQNGVIRATYWNGYVTTEETLRVNAGADVPWKLILLEPAGPLYSSAASLTVFIIILVLILSAIVLFATRYLLEPLIQPLGRITQMAQRLVVDEGDEEDVAMTVSSQEGDELTLLLRSMDNLSRRLFNLTATMKAQVTRRTRDLQVAARLGRETATLYDLDKLINRAIDLICEELGFYHAQVFLVDDVGMNAVLEYSRGEVGKKLLEQHHRIPIGSPSVIGQASVTGKAVVVNDVSKSGTHSYNPLLSRTRAELGLPLVIGSNVLGVLDIQSTNANTFKEEDLPVFQLLADQLAIAIQNARLVIESDRRIQQIDTLNRQLTRVAWEDAQNKIGAKMAFDYDLLNIQQTDPEQAHPDGLSAPISIRGEVIGSLTASNTNGQTFSSSDEVILQAVAERVALVLENVRLFQETQIALTETQVLYQSSRALNEAGTLENILQAITASAITDAISGQLWIFDEHYSGYENPTWMQLTTTFQVEWRAVQVDDLTGKRLFIPEHVFLTQLSNNQITTVEDVQRDNRLDDELRDLLLRLSGASLVVIPLSLRGAWRGILMFGFPQTRSFNERERRIYTALIDQAGVAIDNRLLLEQTEEALSRNENLYAASRIINTATNYANLVNAAVATTHDTHLNFWLGLLEGTRDATGWASQVRIVARSENGKVHETDEVHNYSVQLDSPLRSRSPEVLVDRNPAAPPTSERIRWMRELGAGFIAIFPMFSANLPIATFYVVSDHPRELLPQDIEVYRALTGQMSTQLQNRRLFQEAETERERLSSILTTLPAGVVVLDPETMKPFLFNEKASELLGRTIDPDVPFTPERYHLYRTGTQLTYPEDELPIAVALATGETSFCDDVAVIQDTIQLDLLVNAAPIHDARGNLTAVIGAFEDISNLRSLENTLQENLRETVALYEIQRNLAEASDLEDVLDVVIAQFAMIQPFDGYVLLLDEDLHRPRLVRTWSGSETPLDFITEVVNSDDVVRVVDIQDYPDAALRDQFLALGVQSFIAIPMRVALRETSLGWLVATYDQPDGFTGEQERSLISLGDMASTAIENRYLFQSTRRALQDTAALYTATTSVSRSRDVEQLSDALRAALLFLKPDHYAAYLVREAGAIGPEMLFNVAGDEEPVDFQELLRFALPEDEGTFIEDLAAGSLHGMKSDLSLMNKVRGLAAVNLRVKDVVGGRLFIGYKQPHRFSESETRYLNALADGASLRLDNLLLFDEIQTSLEESSILYQASRALSEASGAQGILDVVVNYVIQPHVNQVFIALLTTRSWSSTNAAVQVVASWASGDDISLQGITLTQDQFPAWNQLATPAVLTINNVEDPDALSPTERIGIESLEAKSVAVIPLRTGQREIGAIWIGSNTPYRHSEREVRIYQAIAEQASLSMEAAHLLEQTNRRARQLETSAKVSENVVQILDLDKLLQELVDLIRDSFGYDHVQVFMMDDDDNFAELRASTGEPGRQLMAIHHKLQRGSASVIGQVTARGEPQIALDTADAAVVHKPNPYLPLTRSEMALPLILKGKVVGALDVQSNQPNAFGQEDVDVLTSLAAQISVAIDNANLYQEARTRADQMGFLFGVTTAATTAETLQGALQTVANQLHQTFQALSVVIYLPQLYADTDDNSFWVIQAVALSGIDQPLTEIEQVRKDDTHNLIGIVGTSLQPVIVDHVPSESRYLPIVSSAQSALIVPMVAANALVGLIAMEDQHSNAYSVDEQQVLLTLARSLSAVVQNTQLVEQLQKSNEQLRELDRLKSDFLANMSHELRTPLNSIIGFSRVMLKGIDGPLTEMQEQDLTTIYNSGQHLLMLINDILDQAKIAAGKMDLKFAFFEIKPLIDSVRSIGIGLVKDRPIQLIVEIAPTVPKAYGDEFRTRQVLLNLVSNACKFTKEGSVAIRVYPYFDESVGKNMVRVDVTDSGIGIADKDLPLLFEAFRQVDSSLTRTVGGTGLGLPIAKSLIEMQGGAMMVSSKVNIGSTFSITIPTEEPPPEETNEDGSQKKDKQTSAKPTTAPLTPPAPRDRRATDTVTVQAVPSVGPSAKIMQIKRQILLIEDNPDLVDQYRRTLQREGFEVFTASIPLEAEAMASGLRPTIIVMDVNFSGGKGWNILERIKERDDTFDIPVVILTLSDESERALAAGAHTFLQRPFTPEDVTKAVLAAEAESNIERILIIDDQPEAVRLLKEVLEEHGKFRVFSANSGPEGISLVARRHPDLIILDLRMPDMDGFAVLQELRSNPETANIPVMVVTGDIINSTEQEQLNNIRVLQKTDISQEAYEQFIDGVRTHLSGTTNGNH